MATKKVNIDIIAKDKSRQALQGVRGNLDKLNEINVQNAKLHYTNRTLNNVSLNERQKDKIVEAVQRAGTVEEAKTIFETLQSAVAGTDGLRKSPKSLNEVINKNS